MKIYTVLASHTVTFHGLDFEQFERFGNMCYDDTEGDFLFHTYKESKGEPYLHRSHFLKSLLLVSRRYDFDKFMQLIKNFASTFYWQEFRDELLWKDPVNKLCR